jgi:hypothetical protein
VLAPPARTNGYYGPIEGRIARVNEIYRLLVACRPEVGIVDWGVLAAPDGSYTPTLPDAEGNDVKVRADDGLHFTPEGVGVLAGVTLEAIDAQWHAVGGRDADRGPATTVAGCAG